MIIRLTSLLIKIMSCKVHCVSDKNDWFTCRSSDSLTDCFMSQGVGRGEVKLLLSGCQP